jgi:K+-transporting ATPase KdpF subunit
VRAAPWRFVVTDTLWVGGVTALLLCYLLYALLVPEKF